ncbi:MarR family winged helix-turn-helix transcriptional regulator [Nocardia sp. IBHARD005]|uniref:MarR family winged helix-turn-helix transcriptional regulator n=1 Tax=Nocardia sp. IBHARD005 TaxID=3457765 RepID=UPI00405949BB
MDQPRWLNEDESRAWHALIAGWSLLNRQIEAQLKSDAGLSHVQYEVLVRLDAAPGGRLRMSELADALVNSKSGLTYQIGRLEKAGLVQRELCPTDIRGVNATLTDAGRDALRHAAPGHVGLVREAFIDVLTPEQLRAIAEGLGKVAHRMQSPTAERPGRHGRSG